MFFFLIILWYIEKDSANFQKKYSYLGSLQIFENENFATRKTHARSQICKITPLYWTVLVYSIQYTSILYVILPLIGGTGSTAHDKYDLRIDCFLLLKTF